jgi:hypothetical protein
MLSRPVQVLEGTRGEMPYAIKVHAQASDVRARLVVVLNWCYLIYVFASSVGLETHT